MNLRKAFTGPLLVCVILANGASGQNFSSHGPGGLDGLSSLADAPFSENVALTCVFETECFESDACTGAGYEAQLTGQAGGMTPDAMALIGNLISEAGNVELLGTRTRDVTTLSGGDIAARHMLTISADAARYTVHFSNGPLVVTYLGLCNQND